MASVNIIKVIDSSVGSMLCSFYSLFSRKKKINLEKRKKILFIQLWSIGETILTLPAIKAVKQKYPDSEISVLCTKRNEEVFTSAKLGINIITMNMNLFSIKLMILKNLRKFDIVVDMEEYLNISALIAFFMGKQRIGFHTKEKRAREKLYNQTAEYNDKQHVVKTFLNLAKVLKADYKSKDIISLNYSKKEENKITSLLKNIPKKSKLIGIVPGAAESGRARMWPLKNYSELCNKLVEKSKNNHIIIIGSDNEKPIAKEILTKIKKENKGNITDLIGKINIRELFCLVEKLNLLVSNDTGPLHIASAQKTKTIGLFGPNTPVRFGPWNKNSIAIYLPKTCKHSPCINVHRGEVPDCMYKRDSKEYQKCMKGIGVDDVLKSTD